MLRELIVENFALIERLHLELEPGFTVLTGETGAGKSIIIDALGAALGERVSPEMIRSGAPKALVEAVFDARDCPRALQAVTEAGLADEGEDTIVLTRLISGGRSSYRVNHRPATLTLLQQVGRHLVDIHGQHQHQALIHEQHHLAFLDTFGSEEYGDLLQQYRDLYEEFIAARRALESCRLSERERAQRIDLLQFQVNEIANAHLTPGEEEELEQERRRLGHAEKLREAVAETHQILEGDGVSGSVVDALVAAENLLSAAARTDSTLQPWAEELAGAAVSAREVARALDDYLQQLQFDPVRLEQVQARLAEIAALKRKYGDTVAEILQFYDQAVAELAELENAEQRTEELLKRLESLRSAAGSVAWQLSAARRTAAARLARRVADELAQLGMRDARFDLQLWQDPDAEGLAADDGQCYAANDRGIDRCRFLLSANKGEELKPLAAVASGGELSRLMLAFKSICARGAEIPTVVFDEIDSGIGGVTAYAVARKLVEVSRQVQVLCVTHLPQIASLADHQVHVTKQVAGDRTVVHTTKVDGEQRVAELMRMLGVSGRPRQAAYQHARQMLQDADRERQRLRAGV